VQITPGAKKIAIFVDVQNIYYTTREAYGRQFNYRKLWNDISLQGEIVVANAYATNRNHNGQERFQEALRHIGFKVKLKPYIQRSDGSGYQFMLIITPNLSIPDHEIKIYAIRAQGSGGQNVNKVSSAAHLRFDIKESSLPDTCKKRLLGLKDSRISKNGILIIKGQKYRTLEKNRNEVKKRLQEIIRLVLVQKKFRRLTKPTQISQTKRLVTKALKSRLKVLRRNVPE